MIVVAYYTEGTPYEEEARIFRSSLERVGMEFRIVGIPDRGSWDANTAEKPKFIRRMRKALKGPIVYIDVDAFVHRDCSSYFDGLTLKRTDFAAHWFAGPAKGHDWSRNCACLAGGACDRPHRLLSGTLFFGDTKGARSILDVWCGYNQLCQDAGWGSGGGQRNLWAIVTSQGERIRQAKLPGRYCYVFDKPQGYPAGEPRIIEHTIGSRDNRGPKQRKNAKRAARIRELERKVWAP